jgi:UDP-N-acetylmuramate dehydrogenase
LSRALAVLEGVPLAPHTTLSLGGAAHRYVRAEDDATIAEALRWARREGLPAYVLGGGSNVVVADEGVSGLVIHVATRGVSFSRAGDETVLRVAAGEPWDAIVAEAVDLDLAGLECLSGIPGTTGATPIQNVGAYGQEVSETIRRVRVLDRASAEVRWLDASECDFGYRDSAFRRRPDRSVLLEVEFSLRRAAPPTIRYPELARHLGGSRASLAETRAGVLELRRAKSMVFDPSDENHRSAGSFFTNPVVSIEVSDDVVARALETGVVAAADDVPRFPAGDRRVKLAAAWLIERAGTTKGLVRGGVGVSSRHALCLINRGAGTTAELLELAAEIRGSVQTRWGVALEMEPVLWGRGTPWGGPASSP